MSRTRLAAIVSAAALAAATFHPSAARAHAHPGPGQPRAAVERADGCEQTSTRVHLSPVDPATYQVVGWLCGPRRPADRRVQFLVHGFSYNHAYWFGLGYPGLDYVRAAARAGHTTFVIDQIGAGLSDRPDPDRVTFEAIAYIAHQLIGDLRAGHIGRAHTRFSRIDAVGHSMGAAMWLVEAATYRDVDAVVLADFLHTTDAAFVARLRSHYVMANTLPHWAHLPTGYLTVQPRGVFYADPNPTLTNIIRRDERVGADTGTSGMVATLATTRQLSHSQAITVPVLLVTGRQDRIGCAPAIGLSCADAAAVIAREAGSYTATRCFNAFVFDAGHSTNLVPGAAEWFTYANQWLDGVHHTPANAGRHHLDRGHRQPLCAPAVQRATP